MITTKDVVLITGANTGLGCQIARKLLCEYGPRFYVLLGCRNAEKGRAALQTLRQDGAKDCEVLQIDNTDIGSIQQAVKTVEEKFGRLDVLHANVI